MKEILFVLYILSGLIKAVFLMYNYDAPIDITPVIAIALFLLILFELIQKKNIRQVFKMDRIKYTIPFGLFYLWIIATLVYSPSESYGFKKAFLFLTNIVAFAIPFLSLNFKVRIFRNAFIAATIILGLIFLLGYPDYPMQRRSILGIENFKIFGTYYLSVAFYLGISTLFAIQIEDYRIRLVTMSLLILILIGTAGRGPIIFTGFLLLIYLFMKSRVIIQKFKVVPRQALIFLSIFIVLNGIAYFAATNVKRLAINYHRTAFRFGIMMKDPNLMDLTQDDSELINEDPDMLSEEELKSREQSMQNASILKRKEHYIYAVKMIFSDVKSFVLGYGCGSYGILKEGVDKRMYPHNLYLEIWFELGLIGLLIFVGFTLQVLYRMFGMPLFLNLIIIYILLNFQKSLSLTDMRVFFGFCSLILFYPGVTRIELPKFLRRS